MQVEFSEKIFRIWFNYFPTILENRHSKTVQTWCFVRSKRKTASLIHSSSKGFSKQAACSWEICLPVHLENQAAILMFLVNLLVGVDDFAFNLSQIIAFQPSTKSVEIRLYVLWSLAKEWKNLEFWSPFRTNWLVFFTPINFLSDNQFLKFIFSWLR